MEWRSSSCCTASSEKKHAARPAAAGGRLPDSMGGPSNLEDTTGQSTAAAAAAAANSAPFPSQSAAVPPYVITTGEAMDAVAAQCERRGLTNAATWLSEMSLHALPCVLEAPLPSTGSLVFVVKELDGHMMHATLASAPTPSASSQQRQLRLQRLHRVALGYFRNGEFQRCHQAILHEIMQTGEPTPMPGAATALEAEGTPQAAGGDVPSLPAPEVVRGFRTTSLPPLLQFLGLYALFMDGMKAKQLTNNANAAGGAGGQQRAVHPHAHVLRAYLLEAMRNPVNTHRPAASHPDTVSPPRPSLRTSAAFTSASNNISTNIGSEKQGVTAPSFTRLEGAVAAEGWDPHTPSSMKQPWTISSASRVAGMKGDSAFPAVAGGGASASQITDGDSSAGSPPLSNFSPAINARNPPGDGSPDAASAAPAPPSANADIGAADLLHIDPYLTWLMGVVLRELRMRQECATFLLAAVTVNPLLRCAWEDLTSLVSREAQLAELDDALEGVEPSFMMDVFAAEVRGLLGVTPMSSMRLRTAATAAAVRRRERGEKDVGQGGALGASSPSPPSLSSTPLSAASPHAINGMSDAVGTAGLHGSAGTPDLGQSRRNPHGKGSLPAGVAPSTSSSPSAAALTNAWECLTLLFPDTPYFLSQLAHFYYHQRNRLDKAVAIYQRIRTLDPHYYGILYDYSNVLYTKRDRLGLSSLVQAVYHADAFRAETNFAVGNYYVLLGQHDRAALHFHRAAAIDPQCAEAWLLLGHAYVEVKNTTAAVEAYRTAVALNERDYRGWYNLGQIYELLEAYHHALYYYWHTTSLRPADPGMWVAVANCLEHDGRVAESIACLERAETYDLNTSPNYPAYVRRIATHHIANSSFTRACVYLVKLVQSPAAASEDLLLALPFLIQHYVQCAYKSIGMLSWLSSNHPVFFSPGMDLSPSSSPASASDGRTAPQRARAAAALEYLRKAEEHLTAMAELVMPGETLTPSTTDGQQQVAVVGDREGETIPVPSLESFADDVSTSGRRRGKPASFGDPAPYCDNATAGSAAPTANSDELPSVAFVRNRHREICTLRTRAMHLMHTPSPQRRRSGTSVPTSASAEGAAGGNQKAFFSAHRAGRR
ncbi:hypothetical protein ABL78_3946 [Leptomonas seymouri]|uniref:Cdc23 domain-containing protein n=1 Tax=Leptomonas seymouri TaxID=5684 RepID=A0A0N1PEG3_LEPSE|nr:hypothetical protein ABL78_3946 [Leptomonas seymouri]|eukprot:KPI86993.1 hypothetical protein ABL78_3946 [Leptomonas seymouri]